MCTAPTTQCVSWLFSRVVYEKIASHLKVWKFEKGLEWRTSGLSYALQTIRINFVVDDIQLRKNNENQNTKEGF